jgi:hypothetical protein
LSYALENALYLWQDGERRVREAPEPYQAHLDRAVAMLVDELRRRLGGTFVVDELAALYGEGTDWANDFAAKHAGSADASDVVDAAFGRYAREASNFAGGRPREEHARPD